jgi:hypothetical protein
MMKSARMQILGILAIGALLGYLAACNNAKSTTDANAAQADKSEKTATQQRGSNPLQVAQAPAATALAAASAVVGADVKRPNILVIWGDDIGITNISV